MNALCFPGNAVLVSTVRRFTVIWCSNQGTWVEQVRRCALYRRLLFCKDTAFAQQQKTLGATNSSYSSGNHQPYLDYAGTAFLSSAVTSLGTAQAEGKTIKGLPPSHYSSCRGRLCLSTPIPVVMQTTALYLNRRAISLAKPALLVSHHNPHQSGYIQNCGQR